MCSILIALKQQEEIMRKSQIEWFLDNEIMLTDLANDANKNINTLADELYQDYLESIFDRDN